MTRRTLFLFYTLPVIVWLLVIFLASTQWGAEQMTLHALIRLLKLLTPDQASAMSVDSLGKTNFLLRKCAHISEYAILALLAVRAIQRGRSRLQWKALTGAFVLCVIYAGLDEFHQSFVGGRTASIHDVAIDATGAAFALLLMTLWFRIKDVERALWQKLSVAAEP